MEKHELRKAINTVQVIYKNEIEAAKIQINLYNKKIYHCQKMISDLDFHYEKFVEGEKQLKKIKEGEWL